MYVANLGGEMVVKKRPQKIYPPFKIASRKPGNVHTLGEIVLECSIVETF